MFEKFSVRFPSLRRSLAAPTIFVLAKHAATARVRLMEQYIPIFVSSIQILGKICSRNNFVALSKLHKAISDETIGTTVLKHFELVGHLNRGGAGAITTRYPHYPNKYVHGYLMKRFTKRNRREILGTHHRYLDERLLDSFYKEIFERRPILWSELIKGNHYAISLSFDGDNHSEGDISLTFDMNGTPIYEIAFTVIPGRLIGSSVGKVVLVARVQGKRNKAEAIGIATRACERIAPPFLLIAAVQSIAAVLGIEAVAGVANDEHLAKSREASSQKISFNYDAFWETLAFKKRDAGIYESEASFPTRQDVNASYRSSVRLKRRYFKERVGESVGAAFARNFLKAHLASMPLEITIDG
jgi:uncharacterized protein VirK/YbjX